MRRAKGLVDLSRRDFCGLACAGFVAACTGSGSGAIQTGPLGGGDDDASPDGGAPDDGPRHDAGTTNPDASAGVACTTTMIDVGAASSYTLGTPKYNSSARVFVVKDANGFYAVSGRCTHEGATMVVSGNDYRCPRHGALFTFDGTIVSGPVSQALVHYAMCDIPGGNLGVETSMTVPKAQRLAG